MNQISIIQSILFVKGSEGVELGEFKKVLGNDISSKEIRQLLEELSQKMAINDECGLCVKNYGDKYYMLTKQENYEYISKMINVVTKNPLTPALLETLAIIAYNQPCTRQKVEHIRNADPAFSFDKLKELELIEELGRAETKGSPILYGVTQKFFDLFGITNISQLPKLNNVNFDAREIDDVNFFDSLR